MIHLNIFFCLICLFGCPDTPESLVPKGSQNILFKVKFSLDVSLEKVSRIYLERLNRSGVRQVAIKSSGAGILEIRVKDVGPRANEILSFLIQSTGQVGFHRVEESTFLFKKATKSLHVDQKSNLIFDPTGGSLQSSDATLIHRVAEHVLAIAPQNSPFAIGFETTPEHTTAYLLAKSTFSNTDIRKAESIYDKNQGTYAISLTFESHAATKLATFTKANVGKRIAIVYDSKVLLAPKIMEPILGGQIRVTMGSGDVKNMKIESDLYAFLFGSQPLPSKPELLEMEFF